MTTKDEALNKMAENARELGLDYEPAPVAEPHKQQSTECGEPVAVYVGETWCGSVVRLYEDLPLETPLYTSPQPAQQQEPVCNKDPRGCWSVRCQLGKVCKNTSPPYEATPLASQRSVKPWVGLTEKEKREARNSVSYSPLAMTMGEWAEAVQDATEAKLKEKNDF